MPRYIYRCSKCEIERTIFHLLSEEIQDCELCGGENTLTKVIGTPHISKVSDNNKDVKIGELTKEFIEKNREILNQQKKEIKEKDYDKT